MDALCIGHACWDIFVRLPEYPAENSKTLTDTTDESGGGPAANAAYLLAKWGVACGFAGRVGDDPFGRQVRAEFEAVGMDLLLLATVPNWPTPLAWITVNTANGSRTIIARKAPGADMHLDEAVARRPKPRALLLDGHETPASLQALKLWPAAISVQDAGTLRDGPRQLAYAVGIVAASERFGLQWTNLPDLQTTACQTECLRLMYRDLRKPIIVTLGERGLIWTTDGGFNSLPAMRVKAVDTTGAGDIFHGALVYGLLKRMALPDALRLGSAAAALSVKRPGGRSSIPTLADVQAAAR